MALLKQQKDESDTDYAVRLKRAKKAKKEYDRKRYKANKEAMLEQKREYYKANKEALLEYAREYRKTHKEAMREHVRKYFTVNKEAINKRKRKRYEAKVLAQAKGGALNAALQRAKRPVMLTRLILQEAEKFCLDYDFSLECRLDTDVLRCAARLIRDSVKLNGEPNPWYGTDFLAESLISQGSWATGLRRTLRGWPRPDILK